MHSHTSFESKRTNSLLFKIVTIGSFCLNIELHNYCCADFQVNYEYVSFSNSFSQGQVENVTKRYVASGNFVSQNLGIL